MESKNKVIQAITDKFAKIIKEYKELGYSNFNVTYIPRYLDGEIEVHYVILLDFKKKSKWKECAIRLEKEKDAKQIFNNIKKLCPKN